MVKTTNLGFPRIGRRRELKRALESYWKGQSSSTELLTSAALVRQQSLQRQRELGIDLVPVGDFSLYDHVLDITTLLGVVPSRYHWDPRTGNVDLDTYFAMARGAQSKGHDVVAMEMTKWFDTNYHYIVPEFVSSQSFHLASDKPWAALAEAQGLGIPAKPVLLGPLSFLLLGKAKEAGLVPWRDLLDAALEVYVEVVRRLAAAGAQWIQFDEPCLVQDRSAGEWEALHRAYARLSAVRGAAKLIVATYFGDLGPAFSTTASLPVQGLALDFVRGPENVTLLQRHGLPADKTLIAGIVDGRNVWISDLAERLQLAERLATLVGPDRLMLSPSCSLLHVPIDLAQERRLRRSDPQLYRWLAFAEQKLGEVVTLARALNEGRAAVKATLAANAEAIADRQHSPRTHAPAVERRLETLTATSFQRPAPFAERQKAQAERLPLPLLPTTTIGSFPQTEEVRQLRAHWRSGELSDAQYTEAVESEIARTIRLQEELGLDVLVHGEFERNDMVEYFGEQLEGFCFTEHGWVQSYGSRYVKPPILYGTVWRPHAMTVRWIQYAQSLTPKPVKGMLTGPVTILQWSFVRDDQPRSKSCWEIALSIADEVADLEAAGIRVIQIDEPALREGLPLRRADWTSYLQWAVDAFRLASAVAQPTTQIHTHMCYSEFNDIMEAISALDADVISIENSRSDQELLRAFEQHRYDKAIGPGVYDIHSPRVPSTEEMAERLHQALEVLEPWQLWVNPDCGLKTRGWDETVPSLRNMVAAATRVRQEIVQ